jgi:hypothetical protein
MPPKQTVPLENFQSALDSAARIFEATRELVLDSERQLLEVDASAPDQPRYRPLTASKIVGLAFLSLIAAWEEFLEETFVRYMAGAQSPSGYAPELRVGSCKTLALARQVLYASADLHQASKGRWNHGDWVRGMAGIYFQKGAPYATIPPRLWRHIEEARFVRNRVAHASDHAKRQFKLAANRLMDKPKDTPLPSGFSPGLLLVSEAPAEFLDGDWRAAPGCRWGDYFEAYLCLFRECAEIIAPGAAE